MPLCPAFALPTDSDHAAQSAATDSVLTIGNSPFVESTKQPKRPAERKSSKLMDKKKLQSKAVAWAQLQPSDACAMVRNDRAGLRGVLAGGVSIKFIGCWNASQIAFPTEVKPGAMSATRIPGGFLCAD